jgi:Spy/CpxP family protein refolding chaperone
MQSMRITLAALLVFGAATAAAAQQAQPSTPRAHGARGKMGPGPGRGMRAGAGLLRGITLSDAEKTNLKAVHEKYAPQMKALREQFKPQSEAMRAARQRGDTAAVRTLWEKNGPAERDAFKKLADAQRNDLRAALSAANQTKFDANAAKLQKRMAKRGGKHEGHRPGIKSPDA